MMFLVMFGQLLDAIAVGAQLFGSLFFHQFSKLLVQIAKVVNSLSVVEETQHPPFRVPFTFRDGKVGGRLIDAHDDRLNKNFPQPCPSLAHQFHAVRC